MSQHKNDHGSMKSYATGFALSLIFTFIPYLMVVNQTVKGTTLLITIVGFAFLQMIIQMTFFLHIGRGPKPNWNLFFFVSTGAIILMVVGGSIIIVNNLHYNMSPTDQAKKIINDEGIYQIGGEETGACQQLLQNHRVVIQDNQVSPLYTFASKCDTISFINDNEEQIEILFGAYPEQLIYAGLTEVVVKPGRSETITLSETGSFGFYYSQFTEASGSFTVNP